MRAHNTGNTLVLNVLSPTVNYDLEDERGGEFTFTLFAQEIKI